MMSPVVAVVEERTIGRMVQEWHMPQETLPGRLSQCLVQERGRPGSYQKSTENRVVKWVQDLSPSCPGTH